MNTKGFIYALLAYLAWGFLPLYWKALDEVPAWGILGHRMVWSLVFLLGILLISRRFHEYRQVIRNKGTARYLGLASLLISTNWLVFIWAVNNGHMVETSLGYYMNPLLNVLLGVLFLKEKLRVGQWAAIALAFTGVAVVTIEHGRLPWVSLVLAGSFALYGLIKKKANVDATLGLAWETTFVAPIAAVYLLYAQFTGQAGTGGLDAWHWILLLLAGAVTVMPLFWFAKAAATLSLSTIGFIQYVGPTITLILGVAVYHETFDMTRWISFGLIWAALIVYTWSSLRAAAQASRVRAGACEAA